MIFNKTNEVVKKIKIYEKDTLDNDIYELEENVEYIQISENNEVMFAYKTIGFLNIEACSEFTQFAIIFDENGIEEKTGYFSPPKCEIWLPFDTEGLFEKRYSLARISADAEAKAKGISENDVGKYETFIVKRMWEYLKELVILKGALYE